MAQSGKIGKFTNEEKIFFIQFLRWRLDRKGPVPDCSELCQDLYVAVCYDKARVSVMTDA